MFDLFGPVKVFDEREVAVGVTRVLTVDPPAGYGISGVEDVTCPANQRVETGATFECELLLDGQHTTVTIIVQNDDGLYEVQLPNQPT